MTLAFNELTLNDCAADNLTVYDGSHSHTAVLGVFCGNATPSAWLRASTSAVTLRVRTDRETPKSGLGFDIAYFSDRSTDHCGAAEHALGARA